MGSYFTYGVFSDSEDFSQAISSLSDKGFDNVTVVKDTEAELYKSATLKSSVKRTFVVFGLVGALIGGIAGAVASPTVPYAGTFQILTPMMSMVSGAIVLAYFSIWVGGFLSWIDTPLHSESFEGSITKGSFLIAVETDSKALRQLAVECFSNCNAVEIIARSESIEGLRRVSTSSEPQLKQVSVQLAA